MVGEARSNGGPRLRFGQFEVDLQTRELRKSGLKVHLQGLPYAVLALLLERPGQRVTREELYSDLWPSTPQIDYEHSLNTAIKKLRRALGDSASRPRYVETLPRLGYRLITPVQSAEETNPGIESFLPRARGQARLWSRLGVAFFGLLCILLTVHILSRQDDTPRIIPLTDYLGRETDPSLSRDGSKVAFSWSGEGVQSDIYLKFLDGAGPLRLTQDPRRDYGPAWSPDGRILAFLRELATGRAAVVLSSLESRVERTAGVISVPIASNHLLDLAGPYIAWTPGGGQLIVTDRQSESEAFALFLLSPKTGEKSRLTRPPHAWQVDTHPAMAPDGRTLAFIRLSESEVANLHLLDLPPGLGTIGEPQPLTSGGHLYRNPAWARDGRRLVVVRGRRGDSSLWTFDTDPNLQPISAIPLARNPEAPTVSAASRRMVYVTVRLTTSISRIAVSSSPDAAQPKRLFSSAGLVMCPAYSPDGKRIAFLSNRSKTLELWVSDHEGAPPVQLTSFGGASLGPPAWSPDGKNIAIDSRTQGNSDIYIIDSRSGRTRRLTHDPSPDTSPSWSRDGMWVYFCSRRTGNAEIWKVDLRGGEAFQVSESGGLYLAEVPGRHCLLVATAGTPSSLVVSGDSIVDDSRIRISLSSPDAFALRRGRLFFVTPADALGVATVAAWRPGDPALVTLAYLRKPAPGFSVSPDGHHILYSEVVEDDTDLMLVEDFDH